MSVGHKDLFKRMIKPLGVRPKKANAASVVMNAVANNNVRPSLEEKCQRGMPASLKRLIMRCWDEKKRRRPSMDDVLEVLRKDVARDLEQMYTNNTRMMGVKENGRRASRTNRKTAGNELRQRVKKNMELSQILPGSS